MSFIQSICGPATSNEFVFSTSNVSSDNASFINLSVLGDATIVTLSTTNFSPTTLDAQVLTAVNGTIATFQSTSSYISNLSVSSMSVDNLSVGEVDITLLDVETIEADRIKIMDTVNSNYSQLVRASDIFTIAGGYIDPLDPSVVYEGQINITSGAGAARAINISLNKANISGNVIDSDIINVSTLNVSDVNAVSVVTVDIDADEGNFGVVNTPFLNVSTLGVSDIVTENVSVINASVNNLSVYNTLDIKDRDGSNHHGSIYNDTSGLHIAGNGEVIRIRSGGAFDEIVVTKTSGRVNISNLNVSQMTGIDVTLTGTMDSTTVIANDINTPLLNVSNISVDEDISCEQIVCADVICNDVTTNFLFDVDLTNNLSAGQGITISSINDVAVISATTSISDPFNISKLNVSNISVDVNVSVTGSLTCDGNISVGLQYTQEIIFMNAAMTTQNSQIISANTQDTYNLLTQNYSIQGSPGIKYLFCDNSLGNTNISNLSCDTVSVAGSFTCNDAQIDDLFNCDMTNTLRGGTSGLDIPFDNMSVEFSTGTLDTLVMMKPNIVLYSVSLLPNILTAAPPTFEMTTGTAQIANANMCNLSVNNLSVLTDITTPAATITDLTIPASGTFDHDFSKNFTAGTGISITHVGDQVTIAATGGSVTDPLNLSKLNVSNISCDEGITTDTITCDLTPNLVAGAGVTITSVGNKPVISGVNSVTANVPVSDFIETLQIIPSGTTAFVNQAVGQGSQLISVYDYQGGTAYTAANLFTVNAGDKIHFNWKQSGWVQTSPGQQSYVICYIVKGTNAIPQAGDRIEVGRIYQYIYSQSDHEEITGSFVYNVTSGFSFYRSQMEGAPNLVTQSSDYGAATATVYRATVPNSIVVPTLIDTTNISVVNLSVTGDITTPSATITDLTIASGGTFNHDLTNNLTAGSNITITSVGGKPVISSSGGGVTDPLNISRLNASDVHTEALNVSGSAAFLSDGLTVFGSTTTQNISTNHISSAGFITAAGDIRASGGFRALGGSGINTTGPFQFNNANNGLGDSWEIYYTGTQFGMGTVSGKDFTINAGYNTGGLVVSGSLNNINMSNCSITNLSLDTLTCDLTSNLTAGTGITITSVGGKPTITSTGGGGGVTDPLNISKLNASNISVDEDVTITRDLNVQRYLDSGRPRFMMLARTTALAQTGAGERLMVFDTNSTGQVAGEFGVANGGEIQVSTGGWYRLSWSIGFIRASGGDRYSFRSYNMTRTNAGGWTYVQLKDRIGSIGYCRSSTLNRETSSVGSVLRYIPANGWVKLQIGAMIQGSSNFASSFNGTNLRASSNFMVEFISSASET